LGCFHEKCGRLLTRDYVYTAGRDFWWKKELTLIFYKNSLKNYSWKSDRNFREINDFHGKIKI